jgi:hypothetical protein
MNNGGMPPGLIEHYVGYRASDLDRGRPSPSVQSLTFLPWKERKPSVARCPR